MIRHTFVLAAAVFAVASVYTHRIDLHVLEIGLLIAAILSIMVWVASMQTAGRRTLVIGTGQITEMNVDDHTCALHNPFISEDDHNAGRAYEEWLAMNMHMDTPAAAIVDITRIARDWGIRQIKGPLPTAAEVRHAIMALRLHSRTREIRLVSKAAGSELMFEAITSHLDADEAL